jgi:hypothetical protein
MSLAPALLAEVPIFQSDKYVNLADPRRVRQFTDIRKSPIFSHARFAANSVSQIQNSAAHIFTAENPH